MCDLIRLRLGINELSVKKRFQPGNVVNKTCPFCPSVLEDESHFLFNCPSYADFRRKYVMDLIAHDIEPSLNTVFENPSTKPFASYTAARNTVSEHV